MSTAGFAIFEMRAPMLSRLTGLSDVRQALQAGGQDVFKGDAEMLRIFGHYVPGSYLALGVIELLILFSSIYLGVHLRFLGGYDEGLDPLFPKALAYTLVLAGSMMAMGLYERQLREDFTGILLRIGASFCLGFVVMGLLLYLFPSLLFGRGVMGIAFGSALIGVSVVRAVFVTLVDTDQLKNRVLILGTGERAAYINKRARRKSDRQGIEIVGYIPCGTEDRRVEGGIIEHDATLLDIVKRHGIDEIVVAIDDRRQSFPMKEIVECRMAGIDVIDLLTFIERQTGKLMIDLLQPSWLVYSDGFRASPFRARSKRMFDLLVSLVLLALTWPLMLLIAIAIFLESGGRGRIFYRQQRVGQQWQVFDLLKFRSMCEDAERDGVAKWADKEDPRVTAVGHFIRMTRLDELPQIFNVLRGDMSFVGPRPERPVFVSELAKKIPYYEERHRVKPGITGWAQIRYPYGASEKDSMEKLQYDLYYVKNFTLFLDLMILLQTAHVVIWGQGAR